MEESSGRAELRPNFVYYGLFFVISNIKVRLHACVKAIKMELFNSDSYCVKAESRSYCHDRGTGAVLGRSLPRIEVIRLCSLWDHLLIYPGAQTWMALVIHYRESVNGEVRIVNGEVRIVWAMRSVCDWMNMSFSCSWYAKRKPSKRETHSCPSVCQVGCCCACSSIVHLNTLELRNKSFDYQT